ncbi:hypothetical protein [Aquibacillus rhizosphaerae]|uniref:Uncharacterized protein n=1 Tax=Aquibacillus rhizosphaerae TaxID=3051431 RepID=A0ABT7LAC8_9BACI|nr:hypothetical protein [Aquibacillus sp. LR5S19]MDL4842832.1 hypothetical protein [Aquibacillus sp. LR5S19]
MTYRVIASFTDKHTNKVYRKDKEYPVEGVSEDRLKELASEDNDREMVLIEEVVEPNEGNSDEGNLAEDATEQTEATLGDEEFPKHTGGGWFELSNGEKIQGKEEALEAEKELK